MVSRSVSNRFKDAKVGDQIKIGKSPWNVVGIFDASHTAYDSEVWEITTKSRAFQRPIYSSLLVRCADAQR